MPGMRLALAAAFTLLAATPASAADAVRLWNHPYGKKQECVKLRGGTESPNPLRQSVDEGPPTRYPSFAIVDDDDGDGIDDDGAANSYRIPRVTGWRAESRTDTCADYGAGWVRLDLTESFQAQGTAQPTPPTLFFHKGGEGYDPARGAPYGHVHLSDLDERPVYGDEAGETGGAGPIPRTDLEARGAHPRDDGTTYGAGRRCTREWPAGTADGSRFAVGTAGPPPDWNYRSSADSGASYLKYANPGRVQFGDGSRDHAHLQWSWVGKWWWNLPREAVSTDDWAFTVGAGYGAVRTLLRPGETVVRCDVNSIVSRAWAAGGTRVVGRVTAINGEITTGGNVFSGWIMHSWEPLRHADADPTQDASYGPRYCVLIPASNPGCPTAPPATRFGGNEVWLGFPYYGSRGEHFADVTGDGRADAVVVNDDHVAVRRSTGSGFGSNEVWLGFPYYGSKSTHFADVTGDGRADAIAVNHDHVAVRRSTGSGFGANEIWIGFPYYGARGEHFVDVTGEGSADVIVVNDDHVAVRRSTGSGFGGNELWIASPYYGAKSTHFADVTGDRRADAIAVNFDHVAVRRAE